MQFKRLKASLEHNAQAEPSIYTALCLMETLIYDIEQESGGLTLDKCEAGDDTLPTKLTWLCRKISARRLSKNGFSFTSDTSTTGRISCIL